MSTTKMKGILKGLRFIYQVFEKSEEKKEHQEIQIGCPTDVKHVAHIGCEGAAVDQPPSWMKEFNSTNEDNTDQSLDNNGTHAPGTVRKVSTKSMRTRERSIKATSPSDDPPALKSSVSNKQNRTKKQLSTNASKTSPSKHPTRKIKESTESTTEEGSVKKVRQKKPKNPEGGSCNKPSRSLKDNNVTLSPPS